MHDYSSILCFVRYLTGQFPSHGLGEPMAYGFQTLSKGAALIVPCNRKHYEILQPRPGFEPTDSRSTLSIQKLDEYLVMQELSPPPSPSPFMYKNFNDFTQHIVKLRLGDCWEIKIQSTLAIITYISNKYVLHKFTVH